MPKSAMQAWGVIALDAGVRQKMSSVFELGGKAVNKNTAMAISGGTNYESNRNHTQHHFKNRPIIPEPPLNQTNEFANAVKKYIGLKRGRLTITNWFGAGVWLCRCSCGDYVTRRSKSFSPEKLNKFDACPDCENLVLLKKRQYFKKTGRECDIEDFA